MQIYSTAGGRYKIKMEPKSGLWYEMRRNDVMKKKTLLKQTYTE